MKLTDTHIGMPLPEKWCNLIKGYTNREDKEEILALVTNTEDNISVHYLNSLLNGHRNVTHKNRPVLNALVVLARKRKSLKPVLSQ